MIESPTWAVFKSFVTSRSLSIQYLDLPSAYHLHAIDGVFHLSYKIDKDASDTADLVDFETNFKPLGNKRFVNRDLNGDPFGRSTVTSSGWTYNQRTVVIETSKLASIINNKIDGTTWGDATIKFYNSGGTELTVQGDLDTDCVKTIIDWEPPFTFDLIGGNMQVIAVPNGYDNSAQMWTLAIPDLPSIYGGSVNMIDGRVLKEGLLVVADGRGTKTLPYSATYHTNKMRTVIVHGAGHKIKCEIVFEIYYQR